MPSIGPVEIIVILVVVILLFGVGRIGKIGGELGKSIREFRKGIQGEDDKGLPPTTTLPPSVPPTSTTPNEQKPL